MGDPTITNVDLASIVFESGEHQDEALVFAGAGTVLEGTILARKAVATAITPVATGTGNGTVTLATVIAGAIVPLVGAYNLELIELGTKNGVAIGAAAATGTGNGTAGAVVAGSKAQAGDYIVTCYDATVSGSEVFKVVAPDGLSLGELTVGVAYLNDHFGITISDGSTDFIVGDYWTITITDTGGLFKLEDPNGLLVGNVIMDAGELAVTLIEIGGMTFTITAGTTDFIVGDSFALTVAADGDLYPYVIAGLGGTQVPLCVLTNPSVATGAGSEYIRPMIKGTVRAERLVIDADGDATNITAAILDQLRSAGVASVSVTDDSVLDNQ